MNHATAAALQRAQRKAAGFIQHLALLACFAYIGCLLAACGGGDEAPLDPNTCYVDGKPMPKGACQ